LTSRGYVDAADAHGMNMRTKQTRWHSYRKGIKIREWTNNERGDIGNKIDKSSLLVAYSRQDIMYKVDRVLGFQTLPTS
jgi:hypothetical protein